MTSISCDTNGLYLLTMLILTLLSYDYYNYIKLFLGYIFPLNYYSLLVIINLIGLYIFFKNITFKITINCEINFNKKDHID